MRSSLPGSVTFTERDVGVPTRATASEPPFHGFVVVAVSAAVGATFAQRAATVSDLDAPPASVAVMVTGSVVSSPRVAVHDQVPAAWVRAPTDAVTVTASPDVLLHVPPKVRGLPSAAAAGVPLRESCGVVLTVIAFRTSIRRVVTVPPPDG